MIEPGAACAASKLLRSYLPPEQHEANGCASPASSTGPRGANCACAVPRLAVSSAKEAAKKWALRAPSRAQRRQRRAHDRPPSTMVKASRSELSNPGLRGPNTKRAPGGPVRPYTARSASLRGRPPLTTSGAGRWSAGRRRDARSVTMLDKTGGRGFGSSRRVVPVDENGNGSLGW